MSRLAVRVFLIDVVLMMAACAAAWAEAQHPIRPGLDLAPVAEAGSALAGIDARVEGDLGPDAVTGVFNR
jgi:hypothetical protein